MLLIKKLAYICKVNKAQNTKQNIMTTDQFIQELETMKFKNIKFIHKSYCTEIQFVDVYGDKQEKTFYPLWEKLEDILKQIKFEK